MKLKPSCLQYSDQGIILMKLSPPVTCVSVCLDDTAEFNQVNTALVSIFKSDAKGKTYSGFFYHHFLCIFFVYLM